MKLSLPRNDLVAALGIATRAISARTAIQTLSGVLIDATGDILRLRSTDMELGLQVELPIKAAEEGQVIVPGRLLLDVVRSFSGDQVELEHLTAEQEVQLSGGSSRFRLRTLPLDDFPPLATAEGAKRLQLSAKPFVETIARVARSASRDETRPHLTGVLVSATDADLRMVATDSYRLSVKETKLEESLEESLEVNVPARTLQELSRITASAEAEQISIAALENQVVFELDGVTVTSRLVEGRFPNYRQLLPESYEHELRLASAELLDVVRRVSLMAQKNAPLRLSLSDGALEVSAITPDVGDATESLPVPFKGEPFAIGFNPEFFRDGLESAESEEVILKLISPLRPGLIQSAEDTGFQYLVMPIRLNV